MTAAVVAAVGAINVDLVLPVGTIPRPGETVLGGRLSRYGGGKGANAAVAAARAGASVSLVGAVGDDDHGRAALAELEADGVGCATVSVAADEATGTALILVSPGGENIVAVAPGANSSLDPDAVGNSLCSIEGLRCVLVSTEVSLDAVLAAARTASSAGVALILNPAPVREGLQEVLDHGAVVTPNRSECAQLAALLGTARDDPEHNARVISRATGSPVVVTMGAEGALVVEEGTDPELIPALPVEAVDATGAGDTFNGVLAAGLASGRPLRASVRLATVAASLSVRSWGARTGIPSAAELEQAARQGYR